MNEHWFVIYKHDYDYVSIEFITMCKDHEYDEYLELIKQYVKNMPHGTYEELPIKTITMKKVVVTTHELVAE